MDRVSPRSLAFSGNRVPLSTIIRNPPLPGFAPFHPWPPWRCRFCSPPVLLQDRDTLVLHEGQHFDHWDRLCLSAGPNQLFHCIYCPHRCNDIGAFAVHIRLHRSVEASRLLWECPYCKWSTDGGGRYLQTHIRRKHCRGPGPRYCPRCQLSYPRQPDNKNPHDRDGCPEYHRCPFCSWFSSHTKAEREEHVRTEHAQVLEDHPTFQLHQLDIAIVLYPT